LRFGAFSISIPNEIQRTMSVVG